MASVSATQSLGSFILAQANAPGVLGELARCAAADPKFPRDGDYLAISKRLNALEAPGEFHDALEDVTTDWRHLV